MGTPKPSTWPTTGGQIQANGMVATRYIVKRKVSAAGPAMASHAAVAPMAFLGHAMQHAKAGVWSVVDGVWSVACGGRRTEDGGRRMGVWVVVVSERDGQRVAFGQRHAPATRPRRPYRS